MRLVNEKSVISQGRLNLDQPIATSSECACEASEATRRAGLGVLDLQGFILQVFRFKSIDAQPLSMWIIKKSHGAAHDQVCHLVA